MDSAAGALVRTERFQNVDVLRGVAALLVVWLHASEVLITVPGIRALGTLGADVPAFLQLGRAGVIAFFAISGFVVASTIKEPKRSGTVDFVIKRFFRLYPAFWLALGLTYVAIWLPQGRVPEATSIAANATMLPSVFGVTAAMGHFWTLEIELVFYALIVVLFAMGKLRDPRVVLALIVVFVLKGSDVLIGKLAWNDSQGHWGQLPLCLAIMLWGSLLRHGYRPEASIGQKLKLWMRPIVLVATALVFGRAILSGLFKAGDVTAFLAGRGTLWGLLMFVCFVLAGTRWPRPLVWFGTISYSIYLLHPVVIYPLYFVLSGLDQQLVAAPVSLFVLLAAVATVGLAAVSYYCVEAPCNRFAASLTRRAPTGVQSAAGASVDPA